MGLKLHDLPPARGLHWVRRGFALWATRPVGFLSLFLAFLFAAMVMAQLLPVVGGVLSLALLPLVSLGYMVAARSALAGGPVHPGQMLEAVRHAEPARRRAQLTLCLAYALGSVLVVGAAHLVDGGAFDRLQELLAKQQAGTESPELDALLVDPRLLWGMVVRLGLATLLAVPFWHAPALVHWGGQSVGQALFSSTLGLWRSRGAFLLYLLGWVGLMVGAGMLITILALATGARGVLGMLVMPLALVFTTAFYASLWFSFEDCYRPDDAAQDAALPPAAPPVSPLN